MAVTGVGLVTPLGWGCEANWRSMLAGGRAVRWLTKEDNIVGLSQRNEDFPLRRWFGAAVPSVPPGVPRSLTFCGAAAREAVAQAGLTAELLQQAGVVVGASKADMGWVDSQWNEPASGPGAGLIQSLQPGSAGMQLAHDIDCRGPLLCPVAACATGLAAVLRGAELIRCGATPIVLAGSVDAALHPGLLASYRRLGVLADPGREPAGCCRPYDEHRQGFAVGEGAGILVLEDWDHARRRGARQLAEWLDGRMACDPTGLTTIDESGSALVNAIQRALAASKVSPEQIDAVQVHGTATRMNDAAESAALRQVFGSSENQLPGWALKGAIGHLMGAAGSVETAATVLALAAGRWPASVNHQTPLSGCPLRFSGLPAGARLRHVLKISLGFGGHVVAGVLRGV